MKIQHYCYTRGEKPDYRDFIIPSKMRGEDMKAVSALVKSILACEFTSDQLSHPPIWILYKTTDVVVWGVCCWNKELSPQQCNTDEKGRNVKGFFSIVISDYSVDGLCIPYELSYFENYYKTVVLPHWFCRQDETFDSLGEGFYQGSFRLIKPSENNHLLNLNTDMFISKRWGESDIEGILSSALTVETISLVVGYDGTLNAPNLKIPVMNSIVKGAREKVVPVKRACPECGEMVSHFTPSGICDKCEERKEVINGPTDSDMDSKELDRIKRKLRDCQYDIAEKEKTIIRLNRRIKILWILCGLLLIVCLWLFKRSDSRLNPLFASERPSAHQSSIIDVQEPHFFLNVDSSSVDILAEGHDSLAIGWKTDCPQIEAKTNGVDWVNIVHKTKDSVFLCIHRNDSSAKRVANLIISTSDGNNKTIEIHQQAAQ